MMFLLHKSEEKIVMYVCREINKVSFSLYPLKLCGLGATPHGYGILYFKHKSVSAIERLHAVCSDGSNFSVRRIK